MRTSLVIVIALAGSGCTHLSFSRQPTEVQRQESVSPEGVHYVDLFLGAGPAAQLGDTVVFDYTAWLKDGKRIDSTLDRGVPIETLLGAAPLEGWNQGIVGMRADGRRRMDVPAELAYGSKGVEDLVPPDAPLTFEVHLVEVRPGKH